MSRAPQLIRPQHIAAMRLPRLDSPEGRARRAAALAERLNRERRQLERRHVLEYLALLVSSLACLLAAAAVIWVALKFVEKVTP